MANRLNTDHFGTCGVSWLHSRSPSLSESRRLGDPGFRTRAGQMVNVCKQAAGVCADDYRRRIDPVHHISIMQQLGYQAEARISVKNGDEIIARICVFHRLAERFPAVCEFDIGWKLPPGANWNTVNGGGAAVPLIAGHAADWVGLKMALYVPAICYAGIRGFGCMPAVRESEPLLF